jgi:hypothetical protein
MASTATARPNPVSWLSRWFAWSAGTFAVVAVGVSFAGTFGKPECMDLDFGSYYRAAQAVQAGQTPYSVDEHGPLGVYPYAPVFPFLLIPLGRLDYLWACRLWLLVNWSALAACSALALRLAYPEAELRQCRWRILGLALVPMGTYLWATLRVGQASLLVVLGCLGWAVLRRRGYRLLGGVCLATACALKLAPGLLIPYLLLRRDARGLAGVALGSVLLFLTPALWVGWNGTVQLHADWIEHTASTQVPIQTYRPGNQSLLAQLARLPPISNGHQCYSEDNLSRLHSFYPIILAVLGAAGFAVLWWRRAGGTWACETVEVALILIGMTLAHPRAWRCNFVALLLPCLLLAREMIERRPRAWSALFALAAVTLAGVLPTHGVLEDSWSVTLWLLEGKHFWGAVAVAAACSWCCQRQPSGKRQVVPQPTVYSRRSAPSSLDSRPPVAIVATLPSA